MLGFRLVFLAHFLHCRGLEHFNVRRLRLSDRLAEFTLDSRLGRMLGVMLARWRPFNPLFPSKVLWLPVAAELLVVLLLRNRLLSLSFDFLEASNLL